MNTSLRISNFITCFVCLKVVKSFTSALEDPCLDVTAVIFRAASNDTLIGSRSYHTGVVNIE